MTHDDKKEIEKIVEKIVDKKLTNFKTEFKAEMVAEFKHYTGIIVESFRHELGIALEFLKDTPKKIEEHDRDIEVLKSDVLILKGQS